MNLSFATLLLFGSAAHTLASTYSDQTSQAGIENFRVVLLGDSYMSGVGARDDNGNPDYYSIPECRRSPSSWGSQYANALAAGNNHNVELVNRACSGGKMPSLVEDRKIGTRPKDANGNCPPPEYPEEEFLVDENPTGPDCSLYLEPQDQAVTELTDLVLLTIGGNDVGFSSVVRGCMAPGSSIPNCQRAIQFAKDTLGSNNFLHEMVTVLLDVVGRLKKDGAKLVLTSYPYLVLDNDYTMTGKNGETFQAGNAIRSLTDMGDKALRFAAHVVSVAYGAERISFFGETKNVFAGHESNGYLGQINPEGWLYDFGNSGVALDEFYHPNAAGHNGWAQAFIESGTFDSVQNSTMGAFDLPEPDNNGDEGNTRKLLRSRS